MHAGLIITLGFLIIRERQPFPFMALYLCLSKSLPDSLRRPVMATLFKTLITSTASGLSLFLAISDILVFLPGFSVTITFSVIRVIYGIIRPKGAYNIVISAVREARSGTFDDSWNRISDGDGYIRAWDGPSNGVERVKQTVLSTEKSFVDQSTT